MKQELLDYLNAELSTYVYLDKSIDVNVQEYCKDRSALITNLITATEAAIFDVPSYTKIEHNSKEYAGIKQETVIDSEERYFNANVPFYDAFIAGCNFILNYKKPEPDGK